VPWFLQDYHKSKNSCCFSRTSIIKESPKEDLPGMRLARTADPQAHSHNAIRTSIGFR
jgi:hypothetical protein